MIAWGDPPSLSADEIKTAKARAAASAAAAVQSGMLVGLGTGSTAAFAIEALAGRVATGLKLCCVATSQASHALAARRGLDVIAFDDLATVDLAIDGADEVDPQLGAVKGAGGALLREKIVARAATRMICIVDPTKLVARLGQAPIPVEILPFARGFVSRAIETLDGTVTVRGGRTDQDNMILDCRFAVLDDPAMLDRQLSDIAGLLGHGLFLHEIDELHVGTPCEVRIIPRTSPHR